MKTNSIKITAISLIACLLADPAIAAAGASAPGLPRHPIQSASALCTQALQPRDLMVHPELNLAPAWRVRHAAGLLLFAVAFRLAGQDHADALFAVVPFSGLFKSLRAIFSKRPVEVPAKVVIDGQRVDRKAMQQIRQLAQHLGFSERAVLMPDPIAAHLTGQSHAVQRISGDQFVVTLVVELARNFKHAQSTVRERIILHRWTGQERLGLEIIAEDAGVGMGDFHSIAAKLAGESSAALGDAFDRGLALSETITALYEQGLGTLVVETGGQRITWSPEGEIQLEGPSDITIGTRLTFRLFADRRFIEDRRATPRKHRNGLLVLLPIVWLTNTGFRSLGLDQAVARGTLYPIALLAPAVVGFSLIVLRRWIGERGTRSDPRLIARAA
jgi:hypothetical protein